MTQPHGKGPQRESRDQIVARPLGWPPSLWIATGLALSLGVFYIVYVILAERDDGRIQRELDDARRENESAS